MTSLVDLPEDVTIETDDQDAFAAYQAAVAAELDALNQMNNTQKRRNTAWHLAWAAVTPQISQNDVFKRPDCVARSTYMGKWKQQGDFTAVVDRVTALTRAYVEGKDGRALERRREALRQREEGIALKLMDKAEHMLNFPLQTAETTSKEEVDENGQRVVYTTIFQPTDKWRQRDAAFLLEKGSVVGRRALNMTRDKTDITTDGEPIKAVVQMYLPANERD